MNFQISLPLPQHDCEVIFQIAGIVYNFSPPILEPLGYGKSFLNPSIQLSVCCPPQFLDLGRSAGNKTTVFFDRCGFLTIFSVFSVVLFICCKCIGSSLIFVQQIPSPLLPPLPFFHPSPPSLYPFPAVRSRLH